MYTRILASSPFHPPPPISLPKNLPFRPPYCNHVIVFLQTLLEQGRADANALGRNSCTPLHLAAEMDNDNICKILVGATCSPLLCYELFCFYLRRTPIIWLSLDRKLESHKWNWSFGSVFTTSWGSAHVTMTPTLIPTSLLIKTSLTRHSNIKD